MANPEKCEWNEINRLKRPNRFKRTTFSSKPVVRAFSDWVDQKYVFHLFSIRNYRNLYVNGKQPWRNIPVDFIQRLSDSVPRRVNEVCKAKGFHTKYCNRYLPN